MSDHLFDDDFGVPGRDFDALDLEHPGRGEVGEFKHPRPEGEDPTADVAELLQHPELLEPPTPVIEGLAYRGMKTLLSSREKFGKSTLVAQAIVSLYAGRPFLDSPTVRGGTLLVGLEEHVAHAVKRFADTPPDEGQVRMFTGPSADAEAWIRYHVEREGHSLVVIDSLTEYARVVRGEVPGDGDNAGWATVTRPLLAIARDLDVAVLVLHHARKSDNAGRGATEIFAAPDACYEMHKTKGDPNERLLTGVGRWPIEDVRARYTDQGEYIRVGGAQITGPVTGPELDGMVLEFIRTHPGTPSSSIKDDVPRKHTEVLRSIGRLEDRGKILDRGDGKGHAWYVAGADLDLVR